MLPAQLALVSATPLSGAAIATRATNTVVWNGTIPVTGSVDIHRGDRRRLVAVGESIFNQASIAYDTDNNSTNDAGDVSDDPATAAPADPTSFVVTDTVAPSVSAAPAAG